MEEDDEAAAGEGTALRRGGGRVANRVAESDAAVASGLDEEAGEAAEDDSHRPLRHPPVVTAPKQLGRPRLHPEPRPQALSVPYLPASLQDAAMLREISRVPSREAIVTTLSERFACALALPALLPPARPVRVFPLPLQAGEEGGSAATRVPAFDGLEPGRMKNAAVSSEGARGGSQQTSARHTREDGAPPGPAGCSARPLPPSLSPAAAAAPHSQFGHQRRQQHDPERRSSPVPEVVLRIAVYAPDECGQRRHAFGLRPTQELEVLGSTPLSALLPLLYCPHDWVLPGAAARRGRAMLYCEGVAYCVEPGEGSAAEEDAATGSPADASVNGPLARAVVAAAAADGPTQPIETRARDATIVAAQPSVSAAVDASRGARTAACGLVMSLPLQSVAHVPPLLPLDWQIPPDLAALAARMTRACDSPSRKVSGVSQLPSSLPPAVGSSGSGDAADSAVTAPPAPVASSLLGVSDPFLAALAAMAAGGPSSSTALLPAGSSMPHMSRLAGQVISRSLLPSSGGGAAVSLQRAGADLGSEGSSLQPHTDTASSGLRSSSPLPPHTVLASTSRGHAGVSHGLASAGLHLAAARMPSASSATGLSSVAAADTSAAGVADHALADGSLPSAGAATNSAAVAVSDPFLAALASMATAQTSVPAAGKSDPFLAALASMAASEQGRRTAALPAVGSASVVPEAPCDHARAARLSPFSPVDGTTVAAERAHAPDGAIAPSAAMADFIAAAIQAMEGVGTLPISTAREGAANAGAAQSGAVRAAVAGIFAPAAIHRPEAEGGVPDAAGPAFPSAAHPLSAAHGSLLGMLRDSLASETESEEGGGADAMGHGSVHVAALIAAADSGAALQSKRSALPAARGSGMDEGRATPAEHEDRRPSPPSPSLPIAPPLPRPINGLGPSYGAPIAEWANRELEAGVATGWGPLQARRMRGVRFSDMCVRLGAHYLYVHQGSCEHILVFTDCRLHNAAADGPLDVQQCAADSGVGATRIGLLGRHTLALPYPRVVSQLRYKRRKCSACAAQPAVRVVYGDPYGQENPEHYCAECYGLLHGSVCAEGSVAAAGPPPQAGEVSHARPGTRSPPFSSLPYRHETLAHASTLQ
jgi:hypothetical protein